MINIIIQYFHFRNRKVKDDFQEVMPEMKVYL
jgi:hypothetical protein